MKLCLSALPSMESFFHSTVRRLPWAIPGPDTEADAPDETAPQGQTVPEQKKKPETRALYFFYAKVKLTDLRRLAEAAEVVRFCNGNNQNMTIAGATLLGVKNVSGLAAAERTRWSSSASTFGKFGLADVIIQLPMDYVPCLKTGRYPDREGKEYLNLCKEFLKQNEVVVLCVGSENQIPAYIGELTPDVVWKQQCVYGATFFNARSRVVGLMKEMSVMD